MRKYSTTHNGQDWSIEFPDNVVFAFNPLYIIIETAPVNLSLQFNVVCDGVTRSIDVELFKGKARIFFSRILQLFFDDYKHFRTLDFTVSLSLAGTNIFSTSFVAIWGSLTLGDRYNAYGLFKFNGKAEYERTRIWFKKFPFKVSMFSLNPDHTIICVRDGIKTPYVPLKSIPQTAPANIDGEWRGSDNKIYQFDTSTQQYFPEDVGNGREYGIFDINPAWSFSQAKKTASFRIGDRATLNVFDPTFDYTFYQNGLTTHIVNLRISNDECGYYLRWLDRHGELQYFLFTKGVETDKNTLGSDTVSDMEQFGPMWFANHIRNTQISSKLTCKCSAVSLPDEIYEYVSTIVSAPVIDLFVGRSASGREIWVPVVITASSYDYDTTQKLHDLVLSFTLPEYKSQTL